MHFELRIGYQSEIVTGILFSKRIYYAITEGAKVLVPYFEVLHVGSVKGPYDANLVFCSCLLDARMKICKKTEGDLLIKCW